ncbi:hypothetical protein BJ165DRAFT_1508138 [Panaeolus papilionaceus]|nr:hypothetical protein BJ165DRAFT_1508138 [Panaeolus papilionaceus]
MRRLSLSFAITGTAVGYEYKLSGAPPVMTIALLDQEQLTSPKVVQEEVAALEFDSKNYRLFSVGDNGRMVFSDPRLTTGRVKCIVKFLSVAALPLTARIPYSQIHLRKSTHGCQMTSPTLLVLDALEKAARKLVKLSRKARCKPLDPEEFDKNTRRLLSRVGNLIRQLPPPKPADEALLETQHKEAIPRLLPFLPDIASFALFSDYLPEDKSDSDDEPGVVPFDRHWKPVSEEKKHKPTRKRRSLRWVAQLAISALRGRGYSSALYGGIAKDLYKTGPCPECVDLVVYIPPGDTPKPDLTAIRTIIMQKDSSSFYISNPQNKDSVESYFFYRPTAVANKKMGFKFAGFDRNGCRVNIILPPQHGLGPLSATTEIKWVESHPVVPQELLG